MLFGDRDSGILLVLVGVIKEVAGLVTKEHGANLWNYQDWIRSTLFQGNR